MQKLLFYGRILINSLPHGRNETTVLPWLDPAVIRSKHADVIFESDERNESESYVLLKHWWIDMASSAHGEWTVCSK